MKFQKILEFRIIAELNLHYYYYYLLLTSNLEKFYIYNDFCKNIT
jgi:hypothetical protein